jgi:FkbM family methyltransferase
MISKIKKIISPVLFLKIKRIIYSKVAIDVNASYSQAGEDAIVRFLFNDKNLKRISYLDLGTNTPDGNNNTYWFYRNGSRGVCVEADKTFIPLILALRPEDKVLNVGVSVGTKNEADFYIFDYKAINTFDKEEAERRANLDKFRITEVVKVPLIHINSLIENNFDSFPDLLSIDIEGLDLEILKAMDFDRFPIPVICAETCVYSKNHIRSKDPAIKDFLLSKGYEVYADTYINTIFVNKDWFYSM